MALDFLLVWIDGAPVRGREPGSWLDRQASVTQAASSSIDSMKCATTQPGARP